MAFKVTFIFKWSVGPRSGGWTESFFLNTTVQGTAFNAAEDLWPKLAAIHGRQTLLTAYRLTDLDELSGRRSEVFTAQTGSENEFTAGNAFTDYPTTALSIKGFGVNNRSSRQWIKGIPDDKTGNGGIYTPGIGQPTDYATRVSVIGATLIIGSFEWSVRYDASTALPTQPTSIDMETGEVTHAAHGQLPNTVLKVKGARNTSAYLNGLWTIVNVTAGTYRLSPWNPRIATANSTWNGTGIFFLKNYGFSRFASWAVERVSEHAVGRPFGALIGQTKSKR